MGIISIIATLLVFTLIVVVHEFGHFIAARKNGILVEEFAVGMGPLLFGRQKGDTLYSIRAFPIGGYCKMLGEDSSSMDNNSFASKTVGQRIVVCLAGVIMNIILALILSTIVLSFSQAFTTTTIAEVSEGMPAQAIGILPGDEIIKLDNKAVRTYDYISYILANNQGETISISVKRDGKVVRGDITPVLVTDEETGVGSYKLGIMMGRRSGLFMETPGFEKVGIVQTFKTAYGRTLYYVKIVVDSVGQMLTFNVKVSDFAGPIGIGQIVDTNLQAAMDTEEGTSIGIGIGNAILFLLNLATLLSANLAVLNLLPIPALDGGRIVFLIIEGIRRKPLDPEKEGMVNLIGFAAVILLAVVVAFNDILRLF